MQQMEVCMFFRQTKTIMATFVAAVCALVAIGQPVLADAVRVDDGPLATMLELPVYQWQDNQTSPRAVVLAIHGLTMHGTVFDACARKLAADGEIVIAIDMRGYGAWYKGGKSKRVNCGQSERDLCALAAAVRKQYKGLPVFVAGESLGGSMAIRLAARHAELIDGLILCAPAIKMYHSCPARTLVDAARGLANRGHQLDVSDFIKNDFSEDSEIAAEGMSDPLIRKDLSMGDVLDSCLLVASTRHYIGKIPSAMPVLVLQGERDRMVNPSGVAVLQSSLKTADKTILLFPQRGHILIETQHVRADTMTSILSWVDMQCILRIPQRATITASSGVSHQGG